MGNRERERESRAALGNRVEVGANKKFQAGVLPPIPPINFERCSLTYAHCACGPPAAANKLDLRFD